MENSDELLLSPSPSGASSQRSTITQLITGIQQNDPDLSTLCLQGIPNVGETSKQLASALQTNSTLKSLTIFGGLSDESAKPLARSLCTNTTLERLDISLNELTDASAVTISQVLLLNRSLRYLDISRNELSDIGGIELANPHIHLSELVLTACHLTDSTGMAFARSLGASWSGHLGTHTHTHLSLAVKPPHGRRWRGAGKWRCDRIQSLRSLDLSTNKLGDQTGAEFAQTLITNATLTDLLLDNNLAITFRTSLAFRVVFQYNSTLTSLLFSNFGAGELDEMTHRNRINAMQRSQKLAALLLPLASQPSTSTESISPAPSSNTRAVENPS